MEIMNREELKRLWFSLPVSQEEIKTITVKVGKNQVIEFTNKKGDTVKYNHDKVFAIMKSGLEKLACWSKFKSYTATNNIPTICRGKELV